MTLKLIEYLLGLFFEENYDASKSENKSIIST